MKKSLEHPEKTDEICTRRATIEIYLPLNSGDVKAKWAENECGYDVNDLIAYIDDFIQDFYEDAPGRTSTSGK